MVRTEWGVKRVCPHCDARFYDLNRKSVVCPKCETTMKVARPSGRVRVKVEADPAPAPAPEPEPEKASATESDDPALGIDLPDEESDDIEDDEDLMEDVSDLGEDDDDMAEVKEHMEEGVKAIE